MGLQRVSLVSFLLVPSANNDGHLSHHQNLSLNRILPADLYILGHWYVESGVYFSVSPFQERHGLEGASTGRSFANNSRLRCSVLVFLLSPRLRVHYIHWVIPNCSLTT